MVKEEFYYDSRDGISKLHAVRYTPDEEEEVRCVVQIVHGMAEYVERYEEFAEYLTSKGIVVTGEDHMGHGKSVGKDGKFGYFCEQDPATVLVRDVHRLKKATQAIYPNVPYIIMGHSMGSFIARNYMFRYGTGVTAAVIMGTGMQGKELISVSKMIAGIQKLIFGSKHVSELLDKLAFGAYNKEKVRLAVKGCGEGGQIYSGSALRVYVYGQWFRHDLRTDLQTAPGGKPGEDTERNAGAAALRNGGSGRRLWAGRP